MREFLAHGFEGSREVEASVEDHTDGIQKVEISDDKLVVDGETLKPLYNFGGESFFVYELENAHIVRDAVGGGDISVEPGKDISDYENESFLVEEPNGSSWTADNMCRAEFELGTFSYDERRECVVCRL